MIIWTSNWEKTGDFELDFHCWRTSKRVQHFARPHARGAKRKIKFRDFVGNRLEHITLALLDPHGITLYSYTVEFFELWDVHRFRNEKSFAKTWPTRSIIVISVNILYYVEYQTAANIELKRQNGSSWFLRIRGLKMHEIFYQNVCSVLVNQCVHSFLKRFQESNTGK